MFDLHKNVPRLESKAFKFLRLKGFERKEI